MNELKKYPIFKKNISNLKTISIDDSDKANIQYLTESMEEVIAFDNVKTEYVNSLGLSEDNASSVDGIFQVSDYLVFIEFKNGNMKNEKKKVKDKIRDSLLIFCDITDKNIRNTRQQIEFILVYNIVKNPLPNQKTKGEVQESDSRTEIAKSISKKAKEEFIRFGLERFKSLYFKDVHTYSVEEFRSYLDENIV